MEVGQLHVYHSPQIFESELSLVNDDCDSGLDPTHSMNWIPKSRCLDLEAQAALYLGT